MITNEWIREMNEYEDFARKRGPHVVVVDAIIAAGKTTFIQVIVPALQARGFRVVVAKEPVDRWEKNGILKTFDEDKSRWGFTFQSTVFVDRINEIRRQFSEHPNADIYILERSPFTDRLFMEMLHEDGTVTDLEKTLYEGWADLWTILVPRLPTLFLYLRPSLDVCMQRIEKRKREGEKKITREYQRKLLEKHDAYLKPSGVLIHNMRIPCIIINTDEDFENDTTIQLKLADYVYRQLCA